MWCDHAKWVWSRKFLIFVFCHFLLGYYLSINLVKTPWRLGNWFSRKSTLSDCTNNKKQRNYLLCLAVSKLISASSDSFCLIASHMMIKYPYCMSTWILWYGMVYDRWSPTASRHRKSTVYYAKWFVGIYLAIFVKILMVKYASYCSIWVLRYRL